jgi:hypothetical protein
MHYDSHHCEVVKVLREPEGQKMLRLARVYGYHGCRRRIQHAANCRIILSKAVKNIPLVFVMS